MTPKLKRTRKRQRRSRCVQRVVRRLIVKYEKARAKYYRWAIKATKRKDLDGQLVYGVMQMAYTEMQTDLERLLEPSNDEVSEAADKRR